MFSIRNFHTFSIPKGHFGQIQHFFKVLKTDFKIQYFQYRVETLLSVRFLILLCSVIWLIN